MAWHGINNDCLAQLTAYQFQATAPFPWHSMQGFLHPDAFAELLTNFPPLELFAFHQGLTRKDGQRPHNRYYLAYETSIYTKKRNARSTPHNKGIAQHHDLPEVWQEFLEELHENLEYRDCIAHLLGVKQYVMRFAWHLGVTSSEVSPHLDSRKKLGTHILYFNTDADWDRAWGGELLVLDGKPKHAQHPDFDDFTGVHPVPSMNNQSFLFKNTPDAWHGVKALTCPEGHYRRLFNIIFEPPYARERSFTASLHRLTARWFTRG